MHGRVASAGRLSSHHHHNAWSCSGCGYADLPMCVMLPREQDKEIGTQPENWSVVDGKLYLNFNDDIQRKWEADISGFITRADRRWPEAVRSMA